MTLLQARTTKLSFCFRSSLSRFAQASAAALIALVLAGAARADTIKEFVVSGTARNISSMDLGSCEENTVCSFSGTMMVDVTSSAAFPDGTVAAIDITFPGLPAFDICCTLNEGGFGFWFTESSNHAGQTLRLTFTTGHTPTLVGFDGGTIIGNVAHMGEMSLYGDLHGSITPVPEPSSLALLGGGVLAFTQVRRRQLM